jgi:metal-responsive CopG/Arc/MetJ family transcriptional regulator
MKTAISIPNKVFQNAEKLATKMGLSRSQLYVTAIQHYVDGHTDETVTAKLNDVYGQSDSNLDPALKKLQAKSLTKDGW